MHYNGEKYYGVKSEITSDVTLGFHHNLEDNYVAVERSRRFCLPSSYNLQGGSIVFT
jgi:hypothetical protein